MKAFRNVLSKILYSLLSTGSTKVDQKRRVMAAKMMGAKMMAATQNINTNKQNQLKITKKTLISIFCCNCVRLLVHRFTFSMLYENIRVKMLSMKIFFQILFVWQFSSEFEKIAIKTTT